MSKISVDATYIWLGLILLGYVSHHFFGWVGVAGVFGITFLIRGIRGSLAAKD